MGSGTQTETNGDIYSGEFENGLYHGKGSIVYADGAVYFGQFVQG